MLESRVRKDGSIRLPTEVMDALALYPGSKYVARVEDGRLLIEKFVEGEDLFEKAARGPDLSAMARIQKEQKDLAVKAKQRFEELLKRPPEVKPEDNPDLWR